MQPRVAVSTAFFCQGFAFASLITRIPAIQEAFGFSEGQLALMLAAVPIVAGVGSVVAGTLAVRWHSAVLLRGCAVLVAIGLVVTGGATTAQSPPCAGFCRGPARSDRRRRSASDPARHKPGKRLPDC